MEIVTHLGTLTVHRVTSLKYTVPLPLSQTATQIARV